VLLHEPSKTATRAGKFAMKWEGPYRVHTVLGKGVYRLAMLDGTLLDKPINARRLKLYHQRDAGEPQVIIDDVAPILVTRNLASYKSGQS